MRMEQPLAMMPSVRVCHQAFEEPAARRVDEPVAEARRGEHVRVIERGVDAGQLAGVASDQRNAAVWTEHEAEWLKGSGVERQHRVPGGIERIAAEYLANDQAPAAEGSRIRLRRRMAIQQRRDEPRIVDAQPRAATDRIDRHDGGTSTERRDGGLKGDG